MDFTKYIKINNILGWAVFAIALFTYTATQEASVSLWDCGEFIPASFKLQVVHPPGAPFFLMLNHFFTIVAKIADNPSLASTMVNFSSALMSALTILFLFWTITALGRKVVATKGQTLSQDQIIAIFGAAVVGALAYTWSDTFWFSAVEGEVYAMSSMFIALVSWLMMKWEARADEADNVKWIVLISFFIGLSSGVHLMSLLAIPAMTVVYYYRKFADHNWKGLLISAIIGVILLGLVQVGVVTGIPTIMASVEKFAVNSLGMPFWSGVFIFLILFIGLLVYLLYYTHKKQRKALHIFVLCATVIFIGYSSYAMVVIRSLANPAIDMNDPQDVYRLLSYLNREQYGDRPIAKGPSYMAYADANGDGQPYDGIIDQKEIGDIYHKGKEKYEFVDKKIDYVYADEFVTLFPRMYSSQEDHMQEYMRWANMGNGEIPSLKDNIVFFFNYQLNHMWFRYFGWNFIGRQNDIQGHGSSVRGNDMTGIDFIDEALFNVPGSSKMPPGYANDKSRNMLYGLPFLLGLLGFYYHVRKDRKSFAYTLIYFGMTGIALTVYLNMPPIQPRERDYVFVGSFYFFSIWIGMGVLMLYDALKSKMSPVLAAGLVSVACFILVPVNMVAKEWDDHDRSNRKVALAYGKNYLNSCPENAILFTNGDNDTYPLWYAQEVEGIRTDVRIINLSLLNTDWYVNQQRLQKHEAPPVPMSMDSSDYEQGRLDVVDYSNGIIKTYNNMRTGITIDPSAYYELDGVIDWVSSDNAKFKFRGRGGSLSNFIPSKSFKISVNDKDALIANGIFTEAQKSYIADEVKWKVRKNRFSKADLVTLDIIAQNAKNNWERPICWAITTGRDVYLNLMPYLRMEGLIYRLVPMRRYVVNDQTIRNIENAGRRVQNQLRNLQNQENADQNRVNTLNQRGNDYYAIREGLINIYNRETVFYTEEEYVKALHKEINPAAVNRHFDRILNATGSNNNPGTEGFAGTDIMYKNVMENFEWGGLATEEDMWVDYVMMRSARNMRTVYARLAQFMLMESEKEKALLQDSSAAATMGISNRELEQFKPEEKRQKAIEVLDKGVESIPPRNVPYAYLYMFTEMTMYVDLYFKLDAPEKAMAIAENIADELFAEMEYYETFRGEREAEGNQLLRQCVNTMEDIITMARNHEQDVSTWQEKLQEIKKRNGLNNQGGRGGNQMNMQQQQQQLKQQQLQQQIQQLQQQQGAGDDQQNDDDVEDE